MFGRNNRFRTMPGPYTARQQIPEPLASVPWVLLRAHAWPGRSRRETEIALEHMSSHAERARYLLPVEAVLHPYASPVGGMRALSSSAQRLATMQRVAVEKHARGMPLTEQEARHVLETRLPQTVHYNELNRAQAVREYGAYYPARQLNFRPPPLALFKALAAAQQPLARVGADPRRALVDDAHARATRAIHQVRGRVMGSL